MDDWKARLERQILPFLASAGWWAFGQGLPLSECMRSIVFKAGIVLLAIYWLYVGVSALLAVLPWPWFPENPVRVLRWLRCRPRIQILLSFPSSKDRGDVADARRFSLTIFEDTNRAGAEVALRYDKARLSMTQTLAGIRRRHEFAPSETGGLISMRHSPGARSIIVEFDWTHAPQGLGEAPNLLADYKLVLSGVRAEIFHSKTLRGTLPESRCKYLHAAAMATMSAPGGKGL